MRHHPGTFLLDWEGTVGTSIRIVCVAVEIWSGYVTNASQNVASWAILLDSMSDSNRQPVRDSKRGLLDKIPKVTTEACFSCCVLLTYSYTFQQPQNFYMAGRRLWRWPWISNLTTYGKQRLRPILYYIRYYSRRNHEKQASPTLLPTRHHTLWHLNSAIFSGRFSICNEILW
jgi:hypothetical protein